MTVDYDVKKGPGTLRRAKPGSSVTAFSTGWQHGQSDRSSQPGSELMDRIVARPYVVSDRVAARIAPCVALPDPGAKPGAEKSGAAPKIRASATVFALRLW